MAQITYADKSTMNENSSIPAINKCQASDMNEIKSVVNGNYNEVGNITNLTTTDKTSVVNAINEVNEKNILCVGLNANTNVSVSKTWTHYNININNLVASIGDKLTFNSSTHRVIVGDGVNYVKVSCFVAIRGIANSIEYNVRKNGTTIASTNFVVPNAGTFVPSSIANMVVPVSNGDYFDITIRAAATGTAIVAGGTNYGLTIEVIN